jgi:hypothetical protein
MNKNTKSLVKHGVQFAVSSELVALSKRIKESRKKEEEEKSVKVEEPVIKEEYEYVFQEPALYQINDVVSGLVETIISNGMEVEEKLLNQSKQVIEIIDILLKSTERDKENVNKVSMS